MVALIFLSFLLILMFYMYSKKKEGNKSKEETFLKPAGKKGLIKDLKYKGSIIQKKEAPNIVEVGRNELGNIRVGDLCKRYFKLLDEINSEKQKSNFSKMELLADESLIYLEPLIIDNMERYNNFKLTEIPAIDSLLPVYSATNNMGKLELLREIVHYFPELELWKERINLAYFDLDLSNQILYVIKNNSGVLQSKIKDFFDNIDRDKIRTIIYYLEKHKRVKREKYKVTYKLYVL